tara:strand:- start:190 stop:462 length:273 start_codon:yes stop_codon:yes gene_type:complete
MVKMLVSTVSDLRNGPIKVLRAANGRVVSVLRRGKIVGYFMSRRSYERLMDRIEDLEDKMLVYERKGGPFRRTTIEELRDLYGSSSKLAE